MTKKKYYNLLHEYNALAIIQKQYELTNQENLNFLQIRTLLIRKIEWWLKELKLNCIWNVERYVNLFNVTNEMLSPIRICEKIDLDDWEKTWGGGITLFGFIRFKNKIFG